MPNVMAALPNIGGVLFNAAKFGWRPLLECRAVTLPRRETRWNLQGCPKLAKIIALQCAVFELWAWDRQTDGHRLRLMPHFGGLTHPSMTNDWLSLSFLNKSALFSVVIIYGCIVWNAHNTVFGSKRSTMCALAVYFLHSTRPGVKWPNSRSSLAACYWLMSALSALPSTRVRHRIKFAGGFLYGVYRPGEWFWINSNRKNGN